MKLLKLSLKSLRNRWLVSLLTIISLALSLVLLLSIERMKRAAEEGFTQTISQTDLIVGARSGPLQLVLYTVFNMGNATHNISWETYEELKRHSAIDWTIPYSLGDGHRGYRVVATNLDFFSHYHFRGDQSITLREGASFSGLWDVVIGADVAKTLNYRMNQKISIAHGVTRGEGVQSHDDKPFRVSGIMAATGTPLDRALYISLEAMEALHMDWKDGAMPTASQTTPLEQIIKENIKIQSITAFFLRTKSRIETLKLQREINQYKKEPLLAVIPGAVLGELWRGLSYVEQILRVISLMTVTVGFFAMLISLMTTLNERRREMAILRSLGAQPSQIRMLLVWEATLLTSAGVTLGVIISWLEFALLGPMIEAEFGLYLAGPSLTWVEGLYIFGALMGGPLIGLIPAARAVRSALKDGLTVRL